MPRKDELRILCYNVLYDTISCDKFSVFQGWLEGDNFRIVFQ